MITFLILFPIGEIIRKCEDDEEFLDPFSSSVRITLDLICLTLSPEQDYSVLKSSARSAPLAPIPSQALVLPCHSPLWINDLVCLNSGGKIQKPPLMTLTGKGRRKSVLRQFILNKRNL